jgi:hypothetical protein
MTIITKYDRNLKNATQNSILVYSLKIRCAGNSHSRRILMIKVTKEELQEIVKMTNTVPEEYRQICFEILLRHALIPQRELPQKAIEEKQDTPPPPLGSSKSFILPIDVRAFLSQYSISEDSLWKLFFLEENQVRPIYQIKTTSKSKAQIQYALLMSLENALFSGEFKVEVEALRLRCKDQKSYDSVNFKTYLKSNSSLFKSITDEPLALSPDGKSELADLIDELIK